MCFCFSEPAPNQSGVEAPIPMTQCPLLSLPGTYTVLLRKTVFTKTVNHRHAIRRIMNACLGVGCAAEVIVEAEEEGSQGSGCRSCSVASRLWPRCDRRL
ncbi:hypothetical protein VZT92_014684 [Zoarces viviparus]|uniref:Uncharacterized protein n=1 Tax=Zoarces viviparus TaxID=48416 RepID=A0AAW1F0S8_ZOAVI